MIEYRVKIWTEEAATKVSISTEGDVCSQLEHAYAFEMVQALRLGIKAGQQRAQQVKPGTVLVQGCDEETAKAMREPLPVSLVTPLLKARGIAMATALRDVLSCLRRGPGSEVIITEERVEAWRTALARWEEINPQSVGGTEG